MAALPRSEVSFRRQGSSGLVWEDRFLSGELNKVNNQQQNQEGEEEKEQQHRGENSKEIPASITVQRSRSNGGGRGYRTGKVSPAIEPPSPKLSACGFCGAFGNKTGKKGQRSKPGKRRSR